MSSEILRLTTIPEDIQTLICTFLSFKSLCLLQRTCKLFHFIGNSPASNHCVDHALYAKLLQLLTLNRFQEFITNSFFKRFSQIKKLQMTASKQASTNKFIFDHWLNRYLNGTLTHLCVCEFDASSLNTNDDTFLSFPHFPQLTAIQFVLCSDGFIHDLLVLHPNARLQQIQISRSRLTIGTVVDTIQSSAYCPKLDTLLMYSAFIDSNALNQSKLTRVPSTGSFDHDNGNVTAVKYQQNKLSVLEFGETDNFYRKPTFRWFIRNNHASLRSLHIDSDTLLKEIDCRSILKNVHEDELDLYGDLTAIDSLQEISLPALNELCIYVQDYCQFQQYLNNVAMDKCMFHTRNLEKLAFTFAMNQCFDEEVQFFDLDDLFDLDPDMLLTDEEPAIPVRNDNLLEFSRLIWSFDVIESLKSLKFVIYLSDLQHLAVLRSVAHFIEFWSGIMSNALYNTQQPLFISMQINVEETNDTFLNALQAIMLKVEQHKHDFVMSLRICTNDDTKQLENFTDSDVWECACADGSVLFVCNSKNVPRRCHWTHSCGYC